MRVRVERTTLPGIGVRHDLVTEAGRRVGVVSHRNGKRDLAIFDPDDPDACVARVTLSDDEAEALADILRASLLLGQLADLRQQAAGLLTEQVEITPGSPFVGRKLGDTRARTRTSASIVAVLRDRGVSGVAGIGKEQVIPSPGPDFVFEAGDSTGPLLARLPDTAWFKSRLRRYAVRQAGHTLEAASAASNPASHDSVKESPATD